LNSKDYLKGKEDLLNEIENLELTFTDRGGRYFETDKLSDWIWEKRKEIRLAKEKIKEK